VLICRGQENLDATEPEKVVLPAVETGYCAKCPLFWYMHQGEPPNGTVHEKACVK
jgi:hypothetical protein